MKKSVITLVCLLVTPLAFAQTNSKGKAKAQTTAEAITVTGTTTANSAEGTATSYQPHKTLVVLMDGAKSPNRYVLNGAGHILNKAGEIVETAIKPGSHVRVFYTNAGDTRIVDKVVVD